MALPGTGPSGNRLNWLQALHSPALVLAWSLADWQRAVRLARRTRLLARLAHGIAEAGLMAQLPLPVQRQLLGEQRLSHARTTAVVWAIERVGLALGDQPCPKVLLKGAAYLGQDLSIARGRLPSDLDVLVPRADLAASQEALQTAGWHELDMDAHDRAHYHEFGHEVPPMQHALHEVELDLHHNILPPRRGIFLPVGQMLARLQPSRYPGWQVFAPTDQVLHSAAHLFNDSELRDRVRDLVDLDGLFRRFGADPTFWPSLITRANELELNQPLVLALHLTSQWLQSPMPVDVLASFHLKPLCRLRLQALLWLFAFALLPEEPDRLPGWRQRFSALVLFLRYHQRRLPLRQMIPHLWHKLRTGHVVAEPA